jgi:hypothetical protein
VHRRVGHDGADSRHHACMAPQLLWGKNTTDSASPRVRPPTPNPPPHSEVQNPRHTLKRLPALNRHVRQESTWIQTCQCSSRWVSQATREAPPWCLSMPRSPRKQRPCSHSNKGTSHKPHKGRASGSTLCSASVVTLVTQCCHTQSWQGAGPAAIQDIQTDTTRGPRQQHTAPVQVDRGHPQELLAYMFAV